MRGAGSPRPVGCGKKQGVLSNLTTRKGPRAVGGGPVRAVLRSRPVLGFASLLPKKSTKPAPLAMLSAFKKVFLREQFEPTWLSVFFNPSYFSKGRLHRYVKACAHHVRGDLLDVGCGQKPYRTLMNVTTYVGMELGETAGPSASPAVDVYYDGRKIPFPDGHFDSVFSAEVFEHIFNLEEILDEVRRVLKIDGTMLITVPFARREHDVPFDFARYTSFGIKHLLEKHGFEVVELHKTSNSIESIVLLTNQYLYNSVFPKGPLTRLAMSCMVVGPLNLGGIVLSAVLPKNEDLFLNAVIVARKKR